MRKLPLLGMTAGLLLASLAGSTRGQTARPLNFRAVNYEVTATLIPSEQSLLSRARVEFEALQASRFVDIELHADLRVRSVADADGKPMSFERQESDPLLVRVTLPQSAPPGQRLTLAFDYEGPVTSEENSPVKGVRLASVTPEAAYLLLSARWFPLTGYPANRYTATFHIEAPEGMMVVGTGAAEPPETVTTAPAPVLRPAPGPGRAPSDTGALASAPPIPARRTRYTFRGSRPEPWGTFVAGELSRYPVSAEGLQISVYAPAGSDESASAAGQQTARAVNHFSEEFGALPDPNLQVAQMPNGSVGSFAAPGLLLVSRRLWEARGNERLMAHLAAEQWWGREVLAASPNDAWVTAGMARYAEALYVRHTAGQEGMNKALEDFAIGALMYEDAAPISQAGRLSPFTSEYRSTVVNKGALVFHMLRAELGEEPFAALLKEFYAKYKGKAARIADFEALAQAAARNLKPRTAGEGKSEGGLNLTPFFAQWLNSTGVPEFKLEYIVYRITKGFKIVGKVKQELDFFHMPVQVRVDTEGNPEVKTIDVLGTNSDFAIETFGRPKPGGITLDPNNNLLKSSPKLRVRASIARGEELAERGLFYDAVRQYQAALEVQKNNSLAHFRIGEAFFYQKNYQASANAFREAIDGDLDLSYKWVEVWSHIYLGKIFDIGGQRERAVNEYNKAQQLADDTGGAQAEVAKYLREPYKEVVAQRSGNP